MGMAVELSIPISEKLLDTNPGDSSSSALVAPPPRKDVDRVKYVCAACGIKAWAGSDDRIVRGQLSRGRYVVCGQGLDVRFKRQHLVFLARGLEQPQFFVTFEPAVAFVEVFRALDAVQ